MTQETAYQKIGIVFILIMLAFLILSPIILPNTWFESHDGLFALMRMDLFKEAFMHGIIYPRWLPDLYGGYGYPMFVFYHPGFYYLTLLFSSLPFYPMSTMYAALLILLVIGGLGAYLLGKALSDTRTGLFGALLFLLTPYIYVDLYVRGDLPELMAILLCPWSFVFLNQIKTRVEDQKTAITPLVFLSLSIAGVILSHLLVTIVFLPVFIVIAIYLSKDFQTQRKRFLILIAASFILGLALSSPYWFTVYQMKKYVSFLAAQNDYFYPPNHTVYFTQLFKRDWGFGLPTPQDAHDTISFQLGLPHFILATLGAWTSRKNRLIQISYIL